MQGHECGRCRPPQRMAVLPYSCLLAARSVTVSQCFVRQCFARQRRAQPVKRTPRLRHNQRRDLGIASCGVDRRVAKQDLDHAQTGACFEQMGREAVPERVCGDLLSDAGTEAGIAACLLEAARIQVFAYAPGGEQVIAGWPCRTLVDPQDFKQTWRQHRVAVFVALALRMRMSWRVASMSLALTATASPTRNPAP